MDKFRRMNQMGRPPHFVEKSKCRALLHTGASYNYECLRDKLKGQTGLRATKVMFHNHADHLLVLLYCKVKLLACTTRSGPASTEHSIAAWATQTFHPLLNAVS